MQITEILADLVAEALKSAQAAGALPVAGEVDIKIERPKLAEHGDFSTSLPLTLARTMRVPPIQIATAIVDAMPQDEMIGSVASAPPGFVNFTLSMDWLQYLVNIVRSQQHCSLIFFGIVFNKISHIIADFWIKTRCRFI